MTSNVKPHNNEQTLILRTCDPNGESHGGFKWPLRVGAMVEAPDWEPTEECGHGLHGLLFGCGVGSFLDWSEDATWLVGEVDEYVDLDGKVKFPSCTVVHVGDRMSAVEYLAARYPDKPIVGVVKVGGDESTLTGGDWSTLTGGYGSTLTGGDCSTLTGGDESTLTGGDWSTLTGGDRSTLTGGYWSTLTGGYRSTLTGGNWSTLTGGDGSTLTGGYGSTLTGGDRSTLTGGDGSTLTGGDGSTLTGGDCSTLTGGYESTLTGGDRSTLTFTRWDSKYYRKISVYVGEGGIKPNTQYRLNDDGKVVEVRQ